MTQLYNYPLITTFSPSTRLMLINQLVTLGNDCKDPGNPMWVDIARLCQLLSLPSTDGIAFWRQDNTYMNSRRLNISKLLMALKLSQNTKSHTYYNCVLREEVPFNDNIRLLPCLIIDNDRTEPKIDNTTVLQYENPHEDTP